MNQDNHEYGHSNLSRQRSRYTFESCCNENYYNDLNAVREIGIAFGHMLHGCSFGHSDIVTKSLLENKLMIPGD